MSKVYLGVGHGGADSGAVGYIREADVNLIIALSCKDFLESNGVEVKISRTSNIDMPLEKRIKECNAYNPNLAIDIHNNAGGGDGFEVYHTLNGGIGKVLSQNIETEIIAIGQNSRGLKTRKNNNGKDYFGFIRQINCPSIITETFFVDNAEDYKIADTLEEQQIIGVAIAKGILKTLNVEIKETPKVEKQNNNNSDNINIVNKNLQHCLNVVYSANLVEDGIIGPKTKQTLNRVYLKNYCENILVNWCQDRLKNHKKYSLKIDGKYGRETENVVRQFQRDNNITADGIIGINTILLLV